MSRFRASGARRNGGARPWPHRILGPPRVASTSNLRLRSPPFSRETARISACVARAGAGLTSQDLGRNYDPAVIEVQIEMLFVIFGAAPKKTRHMAGYRFFA